MAHFNFCLLLLAQFQAWDGIITQVFVKNGIVKEGNRFVMSLVDSGDFLWLKAIGLIVVIAILWVLHKRLPRFAMLATSCLAVFYLGVISWNFLVFFHVI